MTPRKGGRFGGRLASAALLLLALALGGCHHSSSTSVSLVISPTTSTLNVNISEYFYAAVSGGTNNTVTWSINGVPSGSQPSGNPYGSIPEILTPTENDLGQLVSEIVYTAPASVPSGTTVTLTAISTDNTSVTASATITIDPAATVTVNSQQTGPLAAGQTRQFTATVEPAPSQSVDWEVDSLPGGSATLGTINASGLYTAPLSPPPGGTATITAVSLADGTQSGSITVTLTYGTASLQGPYAFTLKGQNSSGPFERAGSFTADGNGGLNTGLEDVTSSSGSSSSCGGSASVSFVGTYTVGVDGRGTLTFNDGQSPSTFRFVMTSYNQVEIIGFATTPPPTGTAQGEADLQSTASFKTSALQGTYLFDFSGQNSSGGAFSEIGEFQADGMGGLHSGLEDVNNAGATSQPTFTGTYCVTGNGRGTAQFVMTSSGTTYNYSFYIVSSGALKFVSLDGSPNPEVAGTAKQQAPTASFSESSLNGNYTFLISGGNASGNIATVGSFAAGGNDLLTSGVLDENAAGTATQDQSFTGTYSVDSTGTGRGEATLNATNRTYSIVFYLDGNGGAIFQENDSGVVSDGIMATQTSASTLTGSWALAAGGAASTTTQEYAAQFLLNSSDMVTSGTLDSSAYPSAAAGLSAPVTGGTLTPVAGTRDTLSLTTSSTTENFVVYVVSPTEMFALEIDPGTLTSGLVLKQY